MRVLNITIMDLLINNNDYAAGAAYHRQQAEKFLQLANSISSQPIFLGTLLPSMSASLQIYATDPAYDTLKKFVEEQAQYHIARKLWLLEKQSLLCGVSTTDSVPTICKDFQSPVLSERL